MRGAVAAEPGEAALGGDRHLSALDLVAGHLLFDEAEQLFEPGFIDAYLARGARRGSWLVIFNLLGFVRSERV